MLLASHHLPSVIAALRLAPDPSQLIEKPLFCLAIPQEGQKPLLHFIVIHLFVNNPGNELCFSDTWSSCYRLETIWGSA